MKKIQLLSLQTSWFLSSCGGQRCLSNEIPLINFQYSKKIKIWKFHIVEVVVVKDARTGGSASRRQDSQEQEEGT